MGGGRYDKLLATFGGEPLEAAGFGFGDAVIIEVSPSHLSPSLPLPPPASLPLPPSRRPPFPLPFAPLLPHFPLPSQLLKTKGLLPTFDASGVQVVVCAFTPELHGAAIEVASKLREAGGAVDLVLESKKPKVRSALLPPPGPHPPHGLTVRPCLRPLNPAP